MTSRTTNETPDVASRLEPGAPTDRRLATQMGGVERLARSTAKCVTIISSNVRFCRVCRVSDRAKTVLYKEYSRVREQDSVARTSSDGTSPFWVGHHELPPTILQNPCPVSALRPHRPTVRAVRQVGQNTGHHNWAQCDACDERFATQARRERECALARFRSETEHRCF